MARSGRTASEMWIAFEPLEKATSGILDVSARACADALKRALDPGGGGTPVAQRRRETSPRTSPFCAVECTFEVAGTVFHITAGIAGLDPHEPQLAAGLWLGTDLHEDLIEVRMGHDLGSVDDPQGVEWAEATFAAIGDRMEEVVGIVAAILPRISPNASLGRGAIIVAVPPQGDRAARVEIEIEP